MKFDLCKEYRFAKGTLTSSKTGKVYDIRLDKDDRFYSYIKPYIAAGKVVGLKKFMIDKIEISDNDNTFFDEDYCSLNSIVLAKYDNNEVFAFELSIKNVKIHNTNVSRQVYENKNWVLVLYEMEVPYQTDITLEMRT